LHQRLLFGPRRLPKTFLPPTRELEYLILNHLLGSEYNVAASRSDELGAGGGPGEFEVPRVASWKGYQMLVRERQPAVILNELG
jgi:hypothetical protein